MSELTNGKQKIDYFEIEDGTYSEDNLCSLIRRSFNYEDWEDVELRVKSYPYEAPSMKLFGIKKVKPDDGEYLEYLRLKRKFKNK